MTADLAFVRHKSRFVVSYAHVNLQRLHGSPSATSAGTPLAGRTTLVVGAGYCLTRNGTHLKAAQDAGCAILCTNSSDPVLRHYGVTPDAVIVRESLDHAADVEASQAPLIVADVCVHPATWTAAGKRLAWAIPCYPHLLRYAELLGVRPTLGGSSSFTTAVHLARTWGSSRIVLVGAGLGSEQDPWDKRKWRGYHPESPRGDQIGTLRPHEKWGEVMHYEGNEHNDKVHESSGQQPPPKIEAIERHTPIDWRGEGLPMINTLVDQKAWLETEASRHARSHDYVNANEGGVGLQGWRVTTLQDVIESIPRPWEATPVTIPAVYPCTKAKQAELTETLIAEAELQLTTAEEMLRHGGPRLDVLRHTEGLHAGSPLASALAAWRVVDGPQSGGMPQLKHTYESLKLAAQDALGILRR